MLNNCQHDLKLSAFAVSFLVLIAAAKTVEAQTYNIIEIGTLGGDQSSRATGINNSGVVVGVSIDKQGRTTAFFWSDGNIKRVPGLQRKHSLVTAINDVGQVVGYERDDKGQYRGYIYSIDKDSPIELPKLRGNRQTLGAGINNSGQVVGRCAEEHHDGSGHEHGENACQAINGTIIDLQATLGLEGKGGKRSDAISINNQGHIAGHFYTSVHIGYSRGYFHMGGGDPIDISTLGGKNTVVSSVNDADQVSGYSQTSTGDLNAFIWDRVRGFQVIRPFPGGTQSLANDINNNGQVVGAADSSDGALRAFIYSNGTLQDLNDLIPSSSGWELVTAKAINDKGQIVGEGVLNGERRAYLLTPRPQ